MALSIFNQQIPFFGNSSFNELAKVPKGHPRGLGAMDVEEYKNGWNVNIDTPGLSEADISIQTDGNLITVSGQRTSEKITEKDDEDSSCYESICERTFGKFTRSFNIGDDANADEITAKLDHGVIHIHIPKKKEQSALEPPRRIRIRGRSKSPLPGTHAREKSPVIHARGRSKSPAGKTAKTPHHHEETPHRKSARGLGLRPDHLRRTAAEEFGSDWVDQ